MNRRILIVDDNESIHRDFRKILRATDTAEVELAAVEAALFGDTQTIVRDGFELDSAFQGKQALEMSVAALEEGRPYAMAFIDMRMPPGWDGIETIEQLWKCDPRLQVAICSAYSDGSWEEVGRRLDLRDRLLILKKPFDNIEVHQLASALTSKWQMERAAEDRMARLEVLVEERTRALRSTNEALEAEVGERRRLEAQLSLRQKLESIGQLAAGIAHEINTPIQYVGDSIYFLKSAFGELQELQNGYERLLDSETSNASEARAHLRAAADVDYLHEEIPRACDRALCGLERVSAIVRAMKEFAHPRNDEQLPSDINEALRTTLLVANNEYKYVSQLETRLGDLPPVVCNINELNQVFLNLIVNAAHAIEAAGKDVSSGRILVETTADATHVSISIADNGTGIPNRIADKVFDPFFTTKEVGRGTGQGLAIAHTIAVINHCGSLTFQSVEGQGTRFVVRLPIAGKPPDAQQKAVS